MSLFLATLLPGLFLVLLGGALVWNNPVVGRTARALPRSAGATWFFFGAGAAWFVWRLSRLGESDLIFFQTPQPVMLAFGILAVLAFVYAPDFLAVRGLQSDSFASSEVDRYLGIPGQAISYKVGERVWLAARDEARAQARESFDLKAWHMKALALGSVGLDVLRAELARG